MNTRLLDYCENEVRKAQAFLDDVRAIQRRAMNAGEDCSSITAQTIGLRERIATYEDVAARARQGEF